MELWYVLWSFPKDKGVYTLVADEDWRQQQQKYQNIIGIYNIKLISIYEVNAYIQ